MVQRQLIRAHRFPKQRKIVLRLAVKNLDTDVADQLKKQIKSALIIAARCYEIDHVILSFRNVQKTNSDGLGVLFSVWTFVAMNMNAAVSFCDCPDNIKRYFELCRLHHIFLIFESEKEALDCRHNKDIEIPN